MSDLTFALRLARRHPVSTVVAVVGLGIAIGANTAVFSVFHAVVLRPLPFEDPARLVRLRGHAGSEDDTRVSPWDFQMLRNAAVFTSLDAYVHTRPFPITGPEGPDIIRTGTVTDGFFKTLGVHPLAGRTFSERETDAVVLSEQLWRRRYNADPGVIGRSATMLAGRPFRIIGVVPGSFQLPEDAEAWTAFDLTSPLFQTREFRDFRPIGRLKPNVEIRQAQAAVDVVTARLSRESPGTNAGWTAEVVSLQTDVARPLRPMLILFVLAAEGVLLIACANVANMLLARIVTRRRELAIRAALGASWRRLARMLLVECLSIATVGGVLGVLCASWAIDAVVALAPKGIPRLGEARIDWIVLGFALALSWVTGIAIALWPAVSLRVRKTPTLSTEQHTYAPKGRAREVLAATQLAIAFVLLASTALTIRSLSRLQHVNPGFRGDHVQTAHVSLSYAKYADEQHQRAFFDEVVRRVRALPGVSDVAIADGIPFSKSSFEVPVSAGGSNRALAKLRFVTPEFFAALRIPQRAGRLFDRTGVAVDDEFAHRFIGGQRAVGTQVRVELAEQSLTAEIVGVVGTIRELDLAEQPPGTVYAPFSGGASADLIVRSYTDVRSLIREEVWAVDRDVPVSDVALLDDRQASSLASPRFRGILIAALAILAVVLATIGVYAVLAYAVEQRTREIAIRKALGAERADILRMVLQRAARFTIAGLVAGILLYGVAGHILRAMLYEIGPWDPPAILYALAAITLVALLAILMPAWRAVRLDPRNALQNS